MGGRALRRRRARRGDRRDRGRRRPARRSPTATSTPASATGRRARYSDLEWGHELYCYGHLIQAAVARAAHARRGRAGRGRPARRRPRLRRRSGRRQPGRVRASRRSRRRSSSSTGSPASERYLEQARLFVDAPRAARAGATSRAAARTSRTSMPLRAARAFRGHAVRALYLACGAVDVAVETGDGELLDAIVRAVGADGRRAHVPHRRHGLAAQRRGRSARTSSCRPTGRTRRRAPGSRR